MNPAHPLPQHPATLLCTVCLEESPVTLMSRLGCNHIHCQTCIQSNGRAALASVPFVPAKCCLVIPVDVLRHAGAFTNEEMQQYLRLTEEATSPQPKLYCHDSNCGAFIAADHKTRRVGECAECGKKTCKTCHKKSHFGACDQAALAEESVADELVYQLADKKGWKKCPNCLKIVQKVGGCNIVSCQCGQDFCYACGQALEDGVHACPPRQQ
ncbi:hypothetical protein F5Y13DRAFT_185703 [Hypoxylon sp. FL1857]|nr:hypothetical protein F5Y13DRAFT_185703 [Hypoxylon sp. FL1857]